MSENAATKTGKVVLVGAGPGDPDLITKAGLRWLMRCDTLVYDHLLSDALVALSEAGEKIFVGKSAGRHALPQGEINALLLRLAREGKTVVRLKGGDPFVFGRGGEECLALREAGIPFEIVPGVTSGLAAAAYAGLPLTMRGLANGVTLITAHPAGATSLPWRELAALGHTLVFYMVMSALDEVAASLLGAGLAADTPALLVERATTSAQRELSERLDGIAQAAKLARMQAPGLLIVGPAAASTARLSWRDAAPLAGKGILFVRAAETHHEAVEELRRLGADVLEVPVLAAVARPLDPQTKDVLTRLSSYACLAFTTPSSVAFFFAAMAVCGVDLRCLAGVKIAAGSRAVTKALATRGFVADLNAETPHTAFRDLLSRAGFAPNSKILLPLSSSATDSLPAQLKALDLFAEVFPIYDTRYQPLDWLAVKLANWRPDAVVCLSGDCATTLLRAAPTLLACEPPPIWASIGAHTARVLSSFSVRPEHRVHAPDLERLLALVVARLETTAVR